jgi:hypothetical protein
MLILVVFILIVLLVLAIVTVVLSSNGGNKLKAESGVETLNGTNYGEPLTGTINFSNSYGNTPSVVTQLVNNTEFVSHAISDVGTEQFSYIVQASPIETTLSAALMTYSAPIYLFDNRYAFGITNGDSANSLVSITKNSNGTYTTNSLVNSVSYTGGDAFGININPGSPAGGIIYEPMFADGSNIHMYHNNLIITPITDLLANSEFSVLSGINNQFSIVAYVNTSFLLKIVYMDSDATVTQVFSTATDGSGSDKFDVNLAVYGVIIPAVSWCNKGKSSGCKVLQSKPGVNNGFIWSATDIQSFDSSSNILYCHMITSGDPVSGLDLLTLNSSGNLTYYKVDGITITTANVTSGVSTETKPKLVYNSSNPAFIYVDSSYTLFYSFFNSYTSLTALKTNTVKSGLYNGRNILYSSESDSNGDIPVIFSTVSFASNNYAVDIFTSNGSQQLHWYVL